MWFVLINHFTTYSRFKAYRDPRVHLLLPEDCAGSGPVCRVLVLLALPSQIGLVIQKAGVRLLKAVLGKSL